MWREISVVVEHNEKRAGGKWVVGSERLHQRDYMYWYQYLMRQKEENYQQNQECSAPAVVCTDVEHFGLYASRCSFEHVLDTCVGVTQPSKCATCYSFVLTLHTCLPTIFFAKNHTAAFLTSAFSSKTCKYIIDTLIHIWYYFALVCWHDQMYDNGSLPIEAPAHFSLAELMRCSQVVSLVAGWMVILRWS